MNYLKNFYREINLIIYPRPPFCTKYYDKPNYLIRNAKYQPIFKNDFSNFNANKYYKSTILEEKKEEELM